MTYQHRSAQITVWRNGRLAGHRWRWHLKAANGLKIGQQAQGNGFRDKRDAIANLEEVLGGVYGEGYRLTPQAAADGHLYTQGELVRFRNVGGAPVEERIFTVVHG